MIETFVSPEDAEILNQVKAHGIKTVEDFEDLAGPAFFISIPSVLLMRRDVRPESKIIYAMVVGLTRVKGKCNPTNEYLSRISGIPERSVRRALVELSTVGLISISLKKDASGTWRYISPLAAKSLYAQFPGLATPAGQIGHPGVSLLATHNNKEDNNKETTSKPIGLNVVDKSNNSKTTATAHLGEKHLGPVRSLVLVWKEVSMVAAGDSAWDKIHFPRCAKAAKSLLEVFAQDQEKAIKCIKAVHKELTAKNLSVTLETVLKKAHEWRQKHMEEKPIESNESKLMRKVCPTCRGRIEAHEDGKMRCELCHHDYSDQMARIVLRVA